MVAACTPNNGIIVHSVRRFIRYHASTPAQDLSQVAPRRRDRGLARAGLSNESLDRVLAQVPIAAEVAEKHCHGWMTVFSSRPPNCGVCKARPLCALIDTPRRVRNFALAMRLFPQR